ncbi:MAG: hypothetical protein ACR2NA_01980 [Solirubrobacterales bacterium]
MGLGRNERRLIAIVGSANPDRNEAGHDWAYDQPLRHPATVLAACEEVGGELAKAGWDIVVYAGENAYGAEGTFIEPAVVKGYMKGDSTRADSVHVLYSRHYPTPEFAAQGEHPDAFEYRADLSSEWEPSFFRSLADVDAALIVGGGRSSYLAGLVCLGRKIPLLAVGTFGGSGHRVLDEMIHAGTPLRQGDFELLGRPDWSPSSARDLVKSLDSQKASLDKEREEVQQQRRTRRRSQSALIALGLFVVASLLVPTALRVSKADTWPELALLFLAPLIAGASGGTIRSLLPRTADVEVGTLGSAALGAVAGGITGLLYLVAQLTSLSDTSLGALTARQYQTFVLFSVAFGFVAGLVLDSVYQKLITAGVADARDI